MSEDFWKRVDQALEISRAYVLTEEERKHIRAAEQAAYEANVNTILQIVEERTDYAFVLASPAIMVQEVLRRSGT